MVRIIPLADAKNLPLWRRPITLLFLNGVSRKLIADRAVFQRNALSVISVLIEVWNLV
jgi:hypothetical protein